MPSKRSHDENDALQSDQLSESGTGANEQTSNPEQHLVSQHSDNVNNNVSEKDNKEQAENSEPSMPSGGMENPINIQQLLRQFWFSIANDIYSFLYYLGLLILRLIRRRSRHFRTQWKTFFQRSKQEWQHFTRSLRIELRNDWRKMLAPVRDVKNRYSILIDALNDEKRYGSNWSVLKTRGHITWFIVKKLSTFFRCILNYIAPVAACFFLYVCIQNFQGLDYGLRLIYNGEEMGIITSESVFNQAETAMRERLSGEEFLNPQTYSVRFELIELEETELLTVDELTDILIQSSGNELKEATGLYLEATVGEGKKMTLVGAVEEGEELLRYLDSMLEKYRTLEMGPDTKIQFIKKIQIKRGLYPVSSISSLGEIKAELNEEERGEQYYTVVSGDNPLRIAAKNGISFDELKALNPEVDISLFPGDTLLISKSVPKMSVKVTTTIKFEEEVEYRIKQETVPTKDVGWTNTKQSGEKGIVEITAAIEIIDGIESAPTPVAKVVVKEAVDEIIQVGGNKPLQTIPQTSAGRLPEGAFAWPTSGGRISPGFRGYYGHTGSDISFSGCYGTPVYASVEGTVVLAKYSNSGYGYHIIVDNGGGMQTLYAHCSELLVSVGDRIVQGQMIGKIGRTGNVTGPHLHFEVRTGGTPVDAAPYLYGTK